MEKIAVKSQKLRWQANPAAEKKAQRKADLQRVLSQQRFPTKTPASSAKTVVSGGPSASSTVEKPAHSSQMALEQWRPQTSQERTALAVRSLALPTRVQTVASRLDRKPSRGIQRRYIPSAPETELRTAQISTDRREAEALSARLRLGEATDQDFTAYLGKIQADYGFSPTLGSQEEMLGQVQSYLVSRQPKVETFAQRQAEERDLLSRIANTVTGAAKQYAGSMGSAVSTLYQSNYKNAMEYLDGGGADPELDGLVDRDEYVRMVGKRSERAVERMNGRADRLSRSGAADIAKAQAGLNPAGRLLTSAGVGITQMAGDAALGAATGGGGMLPMMVRAFGSGAQEARQKGYDESQQALLGLTSAATEYFTERLFGGNPIYDSDVGFVNRLVGKITQNPKVLAALSSPVFDTVSEGLEEVIADILDPVAERAVTGTWTGYDLDRIIEDGAVGVLTAAVAKGGTAAARGVHSYLGQNSVWSELDPVTAEVLAQQAERMFAGESPRFQPEGEAGPVGFPLPVEQKAASMGEAVSTVLKDGGKINPGARIKIREMVGNMPRGEYQIPHVSMPADVTLGPDGVPITESKIPAAIRNYMVHLFRGKVLDIGMDHKVYIGRDGIKEFAFPAQRFSGELKTAKMTAGANLDSTLAPAIFLLNTKDDGHHPEATGGWDNFYVMFETDTGIYSGIVKTKVTDRGRVFHDITEIQKEGDLPTHGVSRMTPPPAKNRSPGKDIAPIGAAKSRADVGIQQPQGLEEQGLSTDIILPQRIKDVNAQFMQQTGETSPAAQTLLSDTAADDMLRDRGMVEYLKRRGGLRLEEGMTQEEKREAVREAVARIVRRD